LLRQEAQGFAVVTGHPNVGLALFAGNPDAIAEVGDHSGMQGDRLSPQFIEFGSPEDIASQNN
jgi:hypothetical protein